MWGPRQFRVASLAECVRLSTSPVVASAAVNSYSGGIWARGAADLAYRRVVEQARQPIFFTDYGVPDTLDGRFELICLHAFLYLHRLKGEPPPATWLCQSFFDEMFADFDRALREMGTGDLSVRKHVKRTARAFYGRIRAYSGHGIPPVPKKGSRAMSWHSARHSLGISLPPFPTPPRLPAW